MIASAIRRRIIANNSLPYGGTDIMGELVIDHNSSLAELEAVIERGLSTFIDVGRALLIVRDTGKYREPGYTTFEDYCSVRWSLKRSSAYKLMDAASVVKEITNVRNWGQILSKLPTTESQVRPLTDKSLTPQQRRDIWSEAVETAPDGKVTAAHVQKTKGGMIYTSAGMSNGHVSPRATAPPAEPIESAAERTRRELAQWEKMLDEIHDFIRQLAARGGVESLVRLWPHEYRQRFAELLDYRSQEFQQLHDQILAIGEKIDAESNRRAFNRSGR
jgi:hypothetical protein